MKNLPYEVVLGAVKDRLAIASAGIDATLDDAVRFQVGAPGKADSTELHERTVHRGDDDANIAAIQEELGGMVDPALYRRALEEASREFIRKRADRHSLDISQYDV